MDNKYTLRPYQQECVDIINNLDSGAGLVSMATGLGKTVVFSHIKRRGRVLILSHRDELVHQPQKYYKNCSFGVECNVEHSNGEDVVSASVQSLARRLHKFSPDDFDTIITDEAHHAAAPSYKKIYDYFNYRLHIGFSATPNRADSVKLDDVFDNIIFSRDLKWGIENGYLCNINCQQVMISYDISHVKKQMGDFAPKELAEAVDIEKANKEIAEVYRKYAKGQTVIFAASVKHAENIAALIPGAVVVSAQTKNRKEIIEKFTRREIPCLVNCMVFTEGTDIPLIETVIIARPTKNQSLYAQMVGRGLRLYDGKKELTLIDCVGVSRRLEICTAPSLIGIDMESLPKEIRDKFNGNIMEIPKMLEEELGKTSPSIWRLNTRQIDLFETKNNIDTGDVNWQYMYDGSLRISIPDETNKGLKHTIMLESMDELGNTVCHVSESRRNSEITEIFVTQRMPFQDAIQHANNYIAKEHGHARMLWDLNAVNKWGSAMATSSQMKWIKKKLPKAEFKKLMDDAGGKLTKKEASFILDRLFG